MWIEIFKSGEHTDSAGKKNIYSVDDLDIIVNKYNEKVAESDAYEAPLVKGHPGSDEPAYGWVESLQRKGDIIFAKLKDVAPELIKEIRDGKFKKVSIALYNDFMLRHIGLLGAMPPAVKGLKNVCFSESKFLEFQLNKNINSEYSDLVNINEELNNKIKDIIFEKDKLNSDLINIKNNLFIEELKNDININDYQKDEILSLFNEISNDELLNKFKNILLFFSKNNMNNTIYDKLKIANYSEYKNTDKDRLNLHLKTLEYLNNNPNISYEEAFILINGENK